MTGTVFVFMILICITLTLIVSWVSHLEDRLNALTGSEEE
jgi:hypothetical protein